MASWSSRRAITSLRMSAMVSSAAWKEMAESSGGLGLSSPCSAPVAVGASGQRHEQLLIRVDCVRQGKRPQPMTARRSGVGGAIKLRRLKLLTATSVSRIQ